jgi:hypothetical protein
MKLEFFDNFRKICKISNFMKIRPVGDELFHAVRQMYGRMDGRTDGRTDGRMGGRIGTQANSRFFKSFERS